MSGTTTMLVVFTVVLLAVMLAPVSALLCYGCTSAINNGCADPFNSSAFGTCNPDLCYKSKTESSGSTVVVRACGTSIYTGSSNLCESATINGAKEERCVCNTDFCNTAPQLSMSAIVMLVILLFAFLIGQFSNQ